MTSNAAVAESESAKMSRVHVHYGQALAIAKKKGTITCSDIQRNLCLSYVTAGKILNHLINDGLVEQGATKTSWVWRG